MTVILMEVILKQIPLALSSNCRTSLKRSKKLEDDCIHHTNTSNLHKRLKHNLILTDSDDDGAD